MHRSMGVFDDIRESYETNGRRAARSFVRTVLRGARISPNAVTTAGCLLNAVAAVYVYQAHYLIAMIVFVVGSVLDALDGAVAKVTGQVSAFGAFLDSTLDRVSEALMLGGMGLLFSRTDHLIATGACFVALACSLLVSYTRARAESLGVQCKGGFASRTERVVLLALGLFLAGVWDPAALRITAYVLAVATALTVVQRVANVHRALPGGRKPRPPRRAPRKRRKSQNDSTTQLTAEQQLE